jgi:predicted RNase H-like nuclease
VTTVLGIDPAWTAHNPSGVALLQKVGTRWRCLGLAPSYEQFIELSRGVPVDWSLPSRGSVPVPHQLIDASLRFGATRVDVVAADMPLSNAPITARRCADTAISRKFGAQGCCAHSPSEIRPGAISDEFSVAFRALGYSLATTATAVGEPGHFFETYPHPALLGLLTSDRRIPYKLARAHTYWRKFEPLTPGERREKVFIEWRRIIGALRHSIDEIHLPLPAIGSSSPHSLRQLKGLEDALDALVCAWVGSRYLDGECTAFGNETAAIWIPDAKDQVRLESNPAASS